MKNYLRKTATTKMWVNCENLQRRTESASKKGTKSEKRGMIERAGLDAGVMVHNQRSKKLILESMRKGRDKWYESYDDL